MEVRWTYASSSTIGEMSLGNFASDELQLGKSNRFSPRFKLTLEPRLASPCLIEFRINCFYSSHPRPVSLSLLFFFGRIRLCRYLSSGRCVERCGSPYFSGRIAMEISRSRKSIQRSRLLSEERFFTSTKGKAIGILGR